MEKVKVTVAIPTFNGKEYLDEVLSSVLNQKTEKYGLSVLVIDSGSSDDTVKIVKKYIKKFLIMGVECRLLEIPNSEFGHGKTRNLAVESSNTEFVAFLTQDATPTSDNWIEKLLEPYAVNKNVVATFGPHIARENCNPVVQRDMENHFCNFGSDKDPVIQKLGKNQEIDGVLGFFSDVNCSIRKSFWKQNPYKNVSYAEDQLMGRDILESGKGKAYCPEASVFHSHTYPLGEYLGRYFDEYRGLKESIGFRDDNVTLLKILPNSLRRFFADAKYILGRRENIRKVIIHLWQAIWMNLYRQIAAYLGGRYELLPKIIINILSLEKARKAK